MNILVAPAPAPAVSAALLLVRLAMGTAFVLHAWPKMQNPTGWMGPMENAPPGILQAVAAIFEFGGGVLVLFGLATRVGALALVSVMIGALALVHIPRGDPYVAPGKVGAELATVYLTIALLIAAIGPGRYSIDALIFGKSVTSPARGATDR